MEEAEEPRHGDVMQRVRSSAGASPSSAPKPGFASPHPLTPCRQFSPLFAPDTGGGKRPAGIPPAHPHLHPQIPSAGGGGGLPYPGFGPSHSRSLSQPAFFSLESLPHLGSSPFGERSPSPASSSSSAAGGDVSGPPPPLSRPSSGRVSGDGLPPRKAHRRSQSDIPLGLFQSSLPPLPQQSPPPRPTPPAQFVKQESEGESSGEGIGDRDAGDDLFNAYMNLDSFDTLNSSGTDGKCGEDMDSRASGTRTNGADSSENEAESSSVNESGSNSRFRTPQAEGKEGNKRSAAGDPTPVTSRHVRGLSMDSLMRKLHFGDESPKLPPSPGNQAGHLSRSGSLDGTTGNLSLEFGNGEFSPGEVKKIMGNEKLAEMAVTDPKRVKRILANRQSAARSKERKMRYISELEHKVQTLQTEATTLSAQLTLLQRDSAGLTSQNNELKFRLQAMEQQAQLRDALNEALTAEVQRLKLATGEITEAQISKSINQQMSMNSRMFQLQQLHSRQQQQQQSAQAPHYQFQSQQQPEQQQQNNAAGKLESNK